MRRDGTENDNGINERNPMSEDSVTAEAKWEVHLTGPDDILPAEDYADAVRQANEINVYYETHQVPTRTEHHPFVWAIPIPKGYSSAWLGPNDHVHNGVCA